MHPGDSCLLESRNVKTQCRGGRSDTRIGMMPNSRVGPTAAAYQAVPAN